MLIHVHVTVKMAIVGIPVKVSAVHAVCNDRCMTYLSALHVYISTALCILCSVAVCSRACLNGGSLDAESCMCDCSGGFSGPNCDSECIEKELSRL